MIVAIPPVLARSAALLLCAALALVPVAADQTDDRLDALFARLGASPDPAAAEEAEFEIWQIWIESGREDVNRLMTLGTQAMSAGRLDEAIAVFGHITEIVPEFAEGWNKRATAYYLADQLAPSVEDIERTLALEPRHFGAISGMGLIFLRRGDDLGALRAFEEVLKVHPNAEGARARVRTLRDRLRRRGA